MPSVVRRINNALLRADQIATAEDAGDTTDYLAPIVADAEAGFGGPLNAFELTKAMIEAGAAGIHYEDQLASEKKCGHLGGKVLVPTAQHVRTLNAARLAADIADVPTLIVARTDALAATLITSDVDERDARFITGDRTAEGFYRVQNGMAPVISRGLAYAPYADLIWVETGTPDLAQAREFAEAIHAEHPDQMLAYNCSPSFNWRAALDDDQIAKFQRELGAMGYRFQFITLANLPLPEPRHVRPGARLRRAGHDRLRRPPGAGVRRPGAGLHRRQAPARGRHRLLRPGLHRHQSGLLHHGADRLHGGRAVPLEVPSGRGAPRTPATGAAAPARTPLRRTA